MIFGFNAKIFDRFGRRKVMLGSFILVAVSSFVTAFGPQKFFGVKFSYIIYAISRSLIGLGTRGINTIGFVLGKHRIRKK